jgi:hypothetical protein
MLYYSYNLYMDWYKWYYGIKEEEPVVIKLDSEKTPHDFPSCNFTQATLNEAIRASINDPPPPPCENTKEAKEVSFAELPKKIKTKAKKKKARR